MPVLTQIRIVLAAALGIAVALVLVRVVPELFRPKAAPEAALPPPGYFRPTPEEWASLTVARISARPFEPAVETDGKVADDDDATTPVYSPFTGHVTRVFAQPGDFVAKGAPLFAVDAAEYVQAQNDLVSAAAGLATATKQLALAQTNERRQEALYAAQGGALKDLEQSRVDLASAEGGFRTAQIALSAVRDRLRILGKSDPEIDALVHSDPAAHWSPEAVVTAPIAGVVTQRQVGVGQNIASTANGGSTPEFTLSDESKVWLLGNVREADAPAMRVGETVHVTVLALPGRDFEGKLDYVAPSLDPASHRLFVHAEVPNPDGVLKPEMFADLRILTGPGRLSPAVPEEAVIYEGAAARVWAVGPNRTLALREIRPGRTDDGLVEVLSGISAGDSVITGGSLFIDRASSSSE